MSMLDTLLQRRGQIATITTERPLRVRKGQTPITKISTFQCRVGVDYDNIQTVREKRESGELPEQNAGLPWGRWITFPYVLEHSGTTYFRCTRIRNNFQPRTTYIRDGAIITKEEAVAAALASEFRHTESDNEVFNIKVSSIRDVV